MTLSVKHLFAASVAAIVMMGSAQAQNVIVRSLDASEAAKVRAAVEASMAAAERGQRIGMVTGTVDPQPEALRGGGVRQELDATTLMFSVARINPEGRVEMVCINSVESARAALNAPVFAKRMSLSAKEQFNVSK
jgi:hypothetical protein